MGFYFHTLRPIAGHVRLETVTERKGEHVIMNFSSFAGGDVRHTDVVTGIQNQLIEKFIAYAHGECEIERL